MATSEQSSFITVSGCACVGKIVCEKRFYQRHAGKGEAKHFYQCHGGHVCLLQLIQPLLVEQGHAHITPVLGLLSKKGLK